MRLIPVNSPNTSNNRLSIMISITSVIASIEKFCKTCEKRFALNFISYPEFYFRFFDKVTYFVKSCNSYHYIVQVVHRINKKQNVFTNVINHCIYDAISLCICSCNIHSDTSVGAVFWCTF